MGTKAVNTDNSSVEENYQYNVFRRVIKKISNDGSEQSYEYDNNSNITSKMNGV